MARILCRVIEFSAVQMMAVFDGRATMKAIQNTRNRFWHGIMAVATGLIVALPLSVARADDDDWEDRWEDYQEELEDRREEARERWEEWNEDREEALEDWRERDDRRGYYAPRHEYRTYRHWQPRYHEHQSGPVYGQYYRDEPRYYRYRHAPRYRYYGTPEIGYSEYGRRRSVQLGPLRLHWDRD
jgi:hypothetical protein